MRTLINGQARRLNKLSRDLVDALVRAETSEKNASELQNKVWNMETKLRDAESSRDRYKETASDRYNRINELTDTLDKERRERRDAAQKLVVEHQDTINKLSREHKAELDKLQSELNALQGIDDLTDRRLLTVQLVEHIVANEKIKAIKVLRELAGLGLKEAKDILEGKKVSQAGTKLSSAGFSLVETAKIKPLDLSKTISS